MSELTDARNARRMTEIDCARLQRENARLRAELIESADALDESAGHLETALATAARVHSVLDDLCRADDAYSGIAQQLRAALEGDHRAD